MKMSAGWILPDAPVYFVTLQYNNLLLTKSLHINYKKPHLVYQTPTVNEV